MNPRTPSAASDRVSDRGFTLPELMIAITLMAMLVSVVTMAIITSIRTAPNVTSRADSSIAVQGITTFLPPDVDSTEPGAFDIDPGTASGCAGTDAGINVVHMTWFEEFYGSITNYVANYRYVPDADGGYIQRVTCSGQFSLSSPSVLTMTAQLSSTLPVVDLYDSNGDGDVDQLKITIETFSGEVVYIDAASKNPAETLPPNVTNPSTTTTSTTTTTIPNAAPVANPTTWTVNASVLSAMTLDATDSDGTIVSSSIGSLPVGWVATTNGTAVDLVAIDAPGTYALTYEVTDNSGATATSTLTVNITAAATTTTTTTSTSTTTTTTTLPPCVVSGISVNPGSVKQKFNSSPSKLADDVDVLVNVTGGYCVGLTLQYDTGAPNSQYVQNLGNAAPYDITLYGHPHGTELWATGTHTLEVRDGFDNLLATTTLTVNPK